MGKLVFHLNLQCTGKIEESFNLDYLNSKEWAARRGENLCEINRTWKMWKDKICGFHVKKPTFCNRPGTVILIEGKYNALTEWVCIVCGAMKPNLISINRICPFGLCRDSNMETMCHKKNSILSISVWKLSMKSTNWRMYHAQVSQITRLGLFFACSNVHWNPFIETP